MGVVRLDLAYDGSRFHGFASQPGQRTVQGELEEALGKLVDPPIETVCAGRTDTGVHARHQVVSFETDAPGDLDRLRRSLDGLLGEEVAVWRVSEAPADFNARFSPTWRVYQYFVDSRPAADPLTRVWVWHLARPLDLVVMNRSASVFVGVHDFASFCRRREGATTVREVLEAGWHQDNGRFVFSVKAKAFCHQMVRSMVGHGVDVGLGRVPATSTSEVLAAGDRQRVGTVAPPHGLILWEVGFDSQ